LPVFLDEREIVPDPHGGDLVQHRVSAVWFSDWDAAGEKERSMTVRSKPRLRKRIMTATLAAIALPLSAQAQSWEYSASVYLWMSALDTTVGTPRFTVETELSFGDILDKLDFAAFAKLEARNGPWVFIGDLNYTDLGTTLGTPGPIISGAEVDTAL
jgi:hypothetical protein